MILKKGHHTDSDLKLGSISQENFTYHYFRVYLNKGVAATGRVKGLIWKNENHTDSSFNFGR